MRFFLFISNNYTFWIDTSYLFSYRSKSSSELRYWKNKKDVEGILANSHYKYFYTEHFKLIDHFYNNKTILDIGCGPRGSLEWASNAHIRIGVDPLIDKYLPLGLDKHEMIYICSSSEKIPLQDAVCDAVFSFNSLDHVDNVTQTIDEVKRVVKSGGIFLLLVEINHHPTKNEPHKLSPVQIVEALKPEYICKNLEVYKPNGEGIYSSIWDKRIIPNPESTDEVGYMSAFFSVDNSLFY